MLPTVLVYKCKFFNCHRKILCSILQKHVIGQLFINSSTDFQKIKSVVTYLNSDTYKSKQKKQQQTTVCTRYIVSAYELN